MLFLWPILFDFNLSLATTFSLFEFIFSCFVPVGFTRRCRTIWDERRRGKDELLSQVENERPYVFPYTFCNWRNETMDAKTQTTLIAIETTGGLGETLCLSRHGLWLENETIEDISQTTVIAVEPTGGLGETLCLSRHGLWLENETVDDWRLSFFQGEDGRPGGSGPIGEKGRPVRRLLLSPTEELYQLVSFLIHNKTTVRS